MLNNDDFMLLAMKSRRGIYRRTVSEDSFWDCLARVRVTSQMLERVFDTCALRMTRLHESLPLLASKQNKPP